MHDKDVTPLPMGRFSRLDISTVGILSVPKRLALERSSRRLCEDASFGIVTFLVVEQSSLEKRPIGVSYTVHRIR